MDEDRLDANQMLRELDFPVAVDDRREILTSYGDAIDPVMRLLTQVRARRDAHPEQKFAIYQLLSRSISDLLAGGHLASHCFVSQAYCVLRPALDSSDLIELFAQDPDAARTWVNTERAHTDFAPGAVRRRLGRDRFDPVHGHFSESGSHPRFAGAQVSGGMRVAVDDPSDRTAIFRIGPMWREHPSTLFVWGFAFNLVLQIAQRCEHLLLLAVDRREAERLWLSAFVETVDAAGKGTGVVLDSLGETAEAPLRTAYAPARRAAESRLAELEASDSADAQARSIRSDSWGDGA